MRVHPAPTTDGNVLEGTLITSNPFNFERRFQVLVIRVRRGKVGEISEPVIPRIGASARQRASDFLELKVL